MKWLPKYDFGRIFSLMLWGLVGIGTIILLVAAVRSNKVRKCKGMEITIKGDGGKVFMDQSEVKRIIASFIGKDIVGLPISEIKIHEIEKSLQKDMWVKNAKLYFDNNEIFKVIVEERQPVARIFTLGGNSFYIDSTLMMLPLSDLFSARLPVFTGFPSDKKVLISRDSLLLKGIKTLSMIIQGDTLLSAFIDQIDITPDREFELIPKIGNQVITFGDAGDAVSKFQKLLIFYKEVLNKGNWSRYNRISLKYDGQVVASLRGVPDPQYDSIRTIQLMQIMAAHAAKLSEDSMQQVKQELPAGGEDVTMIQQSVEREEPSVQANDNKQPSTGVTNSEKPKTDLPKKEKGKVEAAAKPASSVMVTTATAKKTSETKANAAVKKKPTEVKSSGATKKKTNP